MSCSKKELFFSTMQRTREWVYSQEVPTDVTVHVGDASFSLHKLPLMSKCGYIRKYFSKPNIANPSIIKISDIPGGAQGFELAVKFCYGVDFEIGNENIAMLRCVAEYLEMTEYYAVGNLVGSTESYLNEVTLKSLAASASVLLASENLFPMAEQVKLVSRCIDSIAYLACKETEFHERDRVEDGIENENYSIVPQQKDIADWWTENLSMLRIDMFQRVIIAMVARGFKQYALGPILMLYAQKSLRGLEAFGTRRKRIEPKQEHEKRVVIETIVSLLPRDRNVISVSFLTMLLRTAIYIDTTVSCRLDLEKRISLQLGQAFLNDLLIPAYSVTGDTLFDVDTVRRIMMNYLEYRVGKNSQGYVAGEEVVSAPSNDFERMGKLMENYLAEIASDRNLTVCKFIGLAEIVPDQSRVTDDGIYRAIDIFLKAHPTLSEMEKRQVCNLMKCQKLSAEARTHAAQNDRLPVQVVVEILYYDQQHLSITMNGGRETLNYDDTPTATLDGDEQLKLRKENEELKLELLRFKMRLNEFEKQEVVDNINNMSGSSSISSSDQKSSLPRKSIISFVSKKLGRLLMAGGVSTPPKPPDKPSRKRRHSIS